jgi:hypothetical protein
MPGLVPGIHILFFFDDRKIDPPMAKTKKTRSSAAIT